VVGMESSADMCGGNAGDSPSGGRARLRERRRRLFFSVQP